MVKKGNTLKSQRERKYKAKRSFSLLILKSAKKNLIT